MIQKKLVGCMLGLSLSALTLATTSQAQTMEAAPATGGGAMSSEATMQPMQVTGTVLRYYVDRSGYVSAMDVQTANGVQMVRFAPGMGQRIYSTYPVGGQASVYVMGSNAGMMRGSNMMRYDVVGMGDKMPAAGFMAPYTVTDVDLLKSEPYIMTGAKLVQFKGKLSNIITDDMGEVVGLALSGVKLDNAMGVMNAGMSTATTPETTTASTSMMGMGEVLVRVPREFRHINPGAVGASMRVTPLFKGAEVEVVGYPEAPRYGVVSRYAQRVSASSLVLNGRAIGAMGIPMMNKDMSRTLFRFDLAPNSSKEEMDAGMMGYTTYGTGGTGMTDTAPNTSSGSSTPSGAM